MEINILELTSAIRKANEENKKADIWKNIFWNIPIESEEQHDYRKSN